MMWSSTQIPWDLFVCVGAPPSKIQQLWVAGGHIWQRLRRKCLEMSRTREPKREAELFVPPEGQLRWSSLPPLELLAAQAEPQIWPETTLLPLLSCPLPYQLLLEGHPSQTTCL